jgi:hypothetical protein
VANIGDKVMYKWFCLKKAAVKKVPATSRYRREDMLKKICRKRTGG